MVELERRRAPRHRTLKGASIGFNGAMSVKCRVRNLSENGACLDVASTVLIPDDFMLTFDCDRASKPCRVVWRGPERIGVTFAA